MSIFYDSLTFEINLGLIQAVLTSLSRTRKGAFEISLCCCWLSGTVAFLPGSSASFVVLRNDIHHIIILICTEIVIRVPYESSWGGGIEKGFRVIEGEHTLLGFFPPPPRQAGKLKDPKWFMTRNVFLRDLNFKLFYCFFPLYERNLIPEYFSVWLMERVGPDGIAILPGCLKICS